METGLIGAQITKFRKAAGLTQEELGKAVGVSTQAVSRWECGGTPDVALLPAIADRLGVTIDALFGREGGVKEDLKGDVQRWLLSVPEGKRMDQLCRLLWEAAKAIGCRWLEQPQLRYLEHCTMQIDGLEGEEPLLRTVLGLKNEGLIFGVGAEDMSFFSVWPWPEAGYAAWFASMEEYRRLFRVLSRPGCLELLVYLHDELKPRYYTPQALAKQAGLPAEEMEELLKDMGSACLVKTLEMEMESGTVTAYVVHENGAFVPFLNFARCLMEKHDAFYLAWDGFGMGAKEKKDHSGHGGRLSGKENSEQ